jgi:hypothetical protein
LVCKVGEAVRVGPRLELAVASRRFFLVAPFDLPTTLGDQVEVGLG